MSAARPRADSSAPPAGWKLAWDMHPPVKGEPDYPEWQRLAPLMIEYNDALIAAQDAEPTLAALDDVEIPNVPPDEQRKLAAVIVDGVEADPAGEPPPKGKRKTQGERLKEAVDEADVDLFHDAEFRTYATIDHDGHPETWPIRSGGFRRYVSRLVFQRTGAAPRAADLADLLATLEGRAQFQGPMLPVWVRIAPTDTGITIDVGDDAWTAIEVDGDGWRHVTRPSVRFIRPRGLQALHLPLKDGTITMLREFLNVKDEDAWHLIIGFLVMMFRPDGPYPVLAVHGERGSAKSTAMRVLRKLVDPRETLDRSAPRNDHDLAIHAMHNRVVVLDSLSGLPDWLSDALGRDPPLG